MVYKILFLLQDLNTWKIKKGKETTGRGRRSSMSSRLAWSAEAVPGHRRLYCKALSQPHPEKKERKEKGGARKIDKSIKCLL